MSETTQDKSQGQQALEQLGEVLKRFSSARQTLKTALGAIGGVKPRPEESQAVEAGAGEGRTETRFFPALTALTVELDREAAAIEVEIKELARRF